MSLSEREKKGIGEMPQRILSQQEIRLLTGIVRNHRLSWDSNENTKILKSLQNKIENLTKDLDKNNQVIISVFQTERG